MKKKSSGRKRVRAKKTSNVSVRISGKAKQKKLKIFRKKKLKFKIKLFGANKKRDKKITVKMASNVADQFADLELSKEDREQIFEDPTEAAQPQPHTPQNGSR